ncbi:hypothetical protein [Sorangium sp. So ce1335]|uniref:hypothetical protein n=1 Tax=Sorangium sp. So ce1335 TaxID=3133335 RepID=UPI003F601BDF
MHHRLKMKAIPVLIPLGLTVWACNYDLGECYLRGTEGTGAGEPSPPGSAATGDRFGNGGDVGSGATEEMAGCTPDKTCTDMYVDCEDKGYPCTRVIDGGKSLCAICRRDCQLKKRYTYDECYRCGFE